MDINSFKRTDNVPESSSAMSTAAIFPTISTHVESTKNRQQHSNAVNFLDHNQYYIFGYGSLIWKPNFRYLERRLACIPNYVRRCFQASPDHRGTEEHPGIVVTMLPASHPDAQKYKYDHKPLDLPPHFADLSSFSPDQREDILNFYSQNNDCCWGIAYRISAEDVPEIISYLDHREQAGYDCVVTSIHTLKDEDNNRLFFEDWDHDTDGYTDGNDIDPDRPVALVDDVYTRQRTQSISSDSSVLHISRKGRIETVKAVVWYGTTDNPYYTGYKNDDDIATTIAMCRGESGPNYEYVFSLETFMTQCGFHDPHLATVCRLVREKLSTPGWTPWPYKSPAIKLHDTFSHANCSSASHSMRGSTRNGSTTQSRTTQQSSRRGSHTSTTMQSTQNALLLNYQRQKQCNTAYDNNNNTNCPPSVSGRSSGISSSSSSSLSLRYDDNSNNTNRVTGASYTNLRDNESANPYGYDICPTAVAHRTTTTTNNNQSSDNNNNNTNGSNDGSNASDNGSDNSSDDTCSITPLDDITPDHDIGTIHRVSSSKHIYTNNNNNKSRCSLTSHQKTKSHTPLLLPLQSSESDMAFQSSRLSTSFSSTDDIVNTSSSRRDNNNNSNNTSLYRQHSSQTSLDTPGKIQHSSTSFRLSSGTHTLNHHYPSSSGTHHHSHLVLSPLSPTYCSNSGNNNNSVIKQCNTHLTSRRAIVDIADQSATQDQ